jgi:hypothetical protein
MGCEKNNNPNPVSFTPPAQGSCLPAGCGTNASNIIYTGPALMCVGSPTNTDVASILQDIDAAICGASGVDWSTFQYNCLDDVSPITTPAEFVDRMTNYACDLRADFDTFVNTTYATDKSSAAALIDSVIHPALTAPCSHILVDPSLTNSQVLTAIMSSVCSLYTGIDITGVNWGRCYTVTNPPATIKDGFDLVVAQICDLNATISSITPTLPLINNTNTCLVGGTASDSMYTTLIMTRDLACSKASFDVNKIIWAGCITKPIVSPASPIEDTFTSIITKLNEAFMRRLVTFSSDFAVTQQTPGDSCSGFSIALAASTGGNDKLVALSLGDTPDYLMNKIASGSNITLDTTTTPGKVVINSSTKDEKVKSDAADTNPADYLSNKIEGSSDASNAFTLVTAFNAITNKVKISSTVNYHNLVSNILTAIAGDPSLLSQFCGMVCKCDCSTTTTVAPPSTAPTVRFDIFNAGPTAYIGLTAGQLNPSVLWYNNPTFTMNNGTGLSTGNFSITTADSPATGTLTLYNTIGEARDYSIHVEDDKGTWISGATSQSGILPASGSINIPTFIYGNRPIMIVKITV